MTNAVELSIGGIQCDNDACDFEDNTVRFSDYKQWLNKPCPQCGENLLTDADMEAVNNMIKMATDFNEIFGDIDINIDETDRVSVEAKMKGDGSVTVGEIK